MPVKYAEEFKSEIPAFREMTEKFYNKEVSVAEYKGFSGRYGSYAQRGGEASMLRLRLSCGRLEKDKLKFIADCIREYQIDRVHLTTCQTIQLHNLSGTTAGDIMEKAVDHGILTWGGGGDFPRNVMTSPLSGVEEGEYFDVLPYAEKTAEYLMGFINRVKLPRKLKVGFSNSPANVTHATFRDLGFVATPEGKFDVYSAGGLGMNPRMGQKVAEGVEPERILYYVKAMVDTFLAYGNYEKRNKARTRYMQETLGEEGYVAAYREKLEAVFASGEKLDIAVTPAPVEKDGDGSRVSGKRILAQKQTGLYTVVYHPIGGSPKPEKLQEIYETIRDMEAVELRVAPDETLYIINCTGSEAEQVLAVTADGAENLFETSVACIGATICQVGLRDSQGLLQTLVEETRKQNFADGVLPRIHISGCPSSCGTHQIGELGFQGRVKMVDGTAMPAFLLYVGGCEEADAACFGEEWGVMTQQDIPAFLVEVGKAVEAEHTTYDKWIVGNRDRLRKIAEKYL